MESQYLRSALNVTRLALRAKQGATGEAASLVILLMLAELDMRWAQLTEPDELPTPEEIRTLALDKYFAPEKCMQVVDADSSQLRAIDCSLW